MASNALLPMQSFIPMFDGASTPGSLFLSRSPLFTSRRDELYHYRFDTLDLQKRTSSAPKRATVNVVFNPIKNNLDPYVDASNWLPKFKDLCRGYLARKHAADLRKKHEAAIIIQRAAAMHLSPWVQLFRAIQPTLNILKIDEIKKYLRECIIQIMKLNSERSFVESQLGDVENIMERAFQIPDKECFSVEDCRSSNVFTKLIDIQQNANNETFFKECLNIDIEGITDVELHFDPMSCQNSKVHAVYDLAAKIQQKIYEDSQKWKSLQEKCQSLEKEISDLRHTNATLDTNTRTLRGLIAKNEINLNDQTEKCQEHVVMLEKMIQEKKTFQNKIKESERNLSAKDEELVLALGKCEYYETELESKSKLMESLNHDKLRHEKKVQELEEKLKVNLENQNELELTLQSQKARQLEMKKRLTEQLKVTEEELNQTMSSTKIQLSEQSELIEMQEDKIKHLEEMVRKLETQIDAARQHNCSDDEVDYEQRRLNQKLKSAHENIGTMREELKMMESNNEELQKRIAELQINLENANEETTEQKKIAERLKAQLQSSYSSLNDNELKLKRAERERAFSAQKCKQANENNKDLEGKLVKLQEELNHSNQTINNKNREIESLNDDLLEAKKFYENKITQYENDIGELKEKIDERYALETQNSETYKKEYTVYDQKIEALQQSLEDKQREIDQCDAKNLEYEKQIKKFQRIIKDQKDIEEEKNMTILKLKEKNKLLEEENVLQLSSLTNSTTNLSIDHLAIDNHQSLDRNASRIPFSRTKQYSTLPPRRPTNQ